MNVFFSGIGGVGIGPLAEIAKAAGYSVTGTDKADSLMVRELREHDIAIEISEDDTYLRTCHNYEPIDWLVYTSALPLDHPELLAAHELGIKTTKRDELLAHIIAEKNLKLIAVAGTHGKTTTTGMLIWTLKQLGVPVSYSIGTTIPFGPSGHFDSDSELFVYECDEFDRNFLHFKPELSIITSFGYDHSDTYATKEEYALAFRQFIDQSHFSVIWQRDTNAIGASGAHSWSLQGNEVLELPIAGEHNRRNATLVLKALEKLEIGEPTKNRKSIEAFPGTNRRFEKLGENLYSDYGHHPTEIAATLQMAREIADSVVLVYQPHQNVRQYEIRELYKDCFQAAEKVYWLPTYLSREDDSLPVLEPEELYGEVSNKEAVETAAMNDQLLTCLELHRESGDLVLCMGAGSIDQWIRSQKS